MPLLYVKVPSVIEVRTGALRGDGREVTVTTEFWEFIRDQILGSMGSSLDLLDRNMQILRTIRYPDEHGVIALESGWHGEMIKQLQAKDWNMFILMQIKPFVDAIREATAEHPVLAKANGVAAEPAAETAQA